MLSNRAFAIFFIVTILIALSLLLAPKAGAASATWSTTPTNGNWVTTTETNWSTGVGTFPGATSGLTNADTATFLTSSVLAITINNASLNIKSISFGVSGSTPDAFTIGTTAGNSLLLTSGGQIGILSGVTGGSKTETVNAPLVLEPGSASTAGTYTFSNAAPTNKNLQINGAISGGTTSQGITLTLTGANAGGNTFISGAISNGGAAGGLAITKTSSGTWTLSGSGNNSYTGTTTINGGILELAKTSSASVHAISGNITIGDGATTAGLDVLRLAGTGGDQIANTSILTFNGTGTNAGTFRLNGQNETVGGLVSTGGAGVIEDNNATSSTLTVDVNTTNRDFSGIIQNGALGTLALTKTGNATQTLSGANTYTGATTVNQGTLLVNGSTAAGSAVTVNGSGTTLGGTGTIGGTVLVNAGAIINPGPSGTSGTAAAVGTLNTGALTLVSTSIFHADASGTALTSWDKLAVSGLATLGSATFDLTIASGLTFTAGTTYTLIDATSLSGVFAGYADNQTYTFSGYAFTVDYDYGIGNFNLIAVPEPSTWIGGALALAALGFTQRRRLARLVRAAKAA